MSNLNKLLFPSNVTFTEEALTDFLELDHSEQIPVHRAISKVANNPRPQPYGYGKPLSGQLTGCCKIKLRELGIRIIYKLIPPVSDNMSVIIIGLRSDNEVYDKAVRRLK